MTPAALNAVATVALSGSWPSHCHYETRYAAERAGLVEFIVDDEERRRAPGAYRVTDAGREAIAKSRLWQAAQFLISRGFALDRGKRIKPGFVQFRRDDGASAFISSGRNAYEAPAGTWRSALVFENGKAVENG